MNKQSDQQPNDTTTTNLNNKAKSQTESPKQTAPKIKTQGKALNKNTLITSLALCIAVLGSGAAIGLTLWQQDGLTNQLAEQNTSLAKRLTSQQQQFQQQLANFEQQKAALTDQLTAAQTQLKQLDNLVTTVQASQQNIISQVSKVNADPSQTWMLFEAKQLLKQAFLRLRVADINGASRLLEDVNNTIKQRGDLSQTASQVNQAIETALLQLKQVEQIDRPNLYAQLAALQERIVVLQPRQPIFSQSQTTNQTEQSRWQQLQHKLSAYVRVDFNANNKVLPLLSAQAIGQLKMALTLSIEKAQWAALNGEEQIYAAELNLTAQLIEQYFDTKTTDVTALLTKINELKTKTVITKVPDISNTLLLVNNYLDEQINLKVTAKTNKNLQGGNEQ